MDANVITSCIFQYILLTKKTKTTEECKVSLEIFLWDLIKLNTNQRKINVKMGHLKLILGCMFAGKTTELLRHARDAKGFRVLLINHSTDTRYGENCIKTHDGDFEYSTSVEYLRNVNIQNYQVIIIDEGQFFSDLFEYVTMWADTLDVKIVVAGLSGNSQREPFGDILRLIPHAEEIQQLFAKCSLCDDRALYSKFIGTGLPGVGGAESYRQVCRMHLLS